MNGTLLWQTDLGDKSMRNTFGEGSTPALHGNRVVVVWDHTAGSFIAVLDARTGKEIWRQKREESTPGRRRSCASRTAARRSSYPA